MVTRTIATASPGNNGRSSATNAMGKKTRSIRWVEKGPVHRQLVRDVKWCRYGTAPNINAAAVHRDQQREFSKYNQQTIRTKLKEACLLIRLYRSDNCSEEDRVFLESCQLHREPDEAEKNGSRLFVPSSNASSFDMTALTSKLVEMTTLLAESEATNKEITSENRKLQSYNKLLSSERKKLQAKCKSAVDEKLSMQAMCDQLGNEMDKIQSENKHLSSSLDQLRAYTDGLLANCAEDNKHLEALEECRAELKGKQRKIEFLEMRYATDKEAQKREERLLSSSIYELGLDIMNTRLHGGQL